MTAAGGFIRKDVSMSRRYDILHDIASWCAQRELPQEEVVTLVNNVLDSAGQSDYDRDDVKAVEDEINSIRSNVSIIYARTLGYKLPE